MLVVGRVSAVIFLACLALAIVGCGGGEDSSGATSGRSGTASGNSVPNTAEGLTASDDKPTKAEEESGVTLSKPGIPKPTGMPPKGLVKDDVIPGVGNVAKDGDEVTVNYVGFDFKTGKEFGGSWDGEEPLTFTLGNEEVIPGWDLGIVGMRENGRRELIIPPDLANGDQPPNIAPNETLVFLVDLVAVN